MMAWARRFAAPLYLFLCLLLGGSAQGVAANALLRLLAILLIAWAALHCSWHRFRRSEKLLAGLAAGAVGCGLLQLVPIPSPIWSSLPGHDRYAEGFELLGIAPGWLPLSLGPYDTVATLLATLPALGMLAAMLAFRETSRGWLVGAMIAGAGAGVLLGALQVSSPDPSASRWYLYRQSNFGVATGFFANGNHMATLLLGCIPFIAAAMASLRERTDDARKRWAIAAVGAGAMALALLGLVLNGSLAGFVLAAPVLLASLVLLLRDWPQRSLFAPLGISIAIIGAVALVSVHMASSRAVDAAGSIESRKEIFRNSASLAADFAPLGSGIGTFEKVYRTTEDPGEVDRFYVNHAHNDYLELAVETGVPGILLVLLFLAWWVSAARSKLKRAPLDRLAAAGTIASAMILLHSLVDYPLRTAAIGALFAMCLAFMAASRRSDRREGELRPARHLVVG